MIILIIIIIIIKLLKENKKDKQTNKITTNKTLTHNRQNTYRGRERERERKKKLIYYIQTIKRLPC